MAASPRTSPRTILHADMDAFFVSVELRRHPELVGRPVVVGGTGNRGVVAAASYEARRYGVHSALPSAIAKRRCPHAVFLPGDHDHYGEVSRQVREVFDRYTPLVEPLSLDEAFLDVTGSLKLFGDGVTIGHRIRDDIRDELQLGCSVGVATNKFLAKLASVEAKPQAHRDRIEPGEGVTLVRPDAEQEFLDRLPVKRLWGVGPATLEKLERLGIATVRDLRRIDLPVLSTAIGPNLAGHLAALAVGADDREVDPDREAKSISHEETYPLDKHTPREMRRELVRLADAVAQRMRNQGVGARTWQVKVRFAAGFTTITRSVTTGDHLDRAPDILELVGPVLDAVDPSPGVRLLGLSGSNLGQPAAQLTFDDLDVSTPDVGATTHALDAIRQRFGDGAIGPASAVSAGRLTTVRRGSQQWGPDEDRTSR
ncbi:MAG: DNA polymerase IV [Ilumatobacter sp.]|uniref:DNA polymerase IV n=1 Tax=Ilumatobacter sp. TaxID=1967498 RepID=UPI003299AF46